HIHKFGCAAYCYINKKIGHKKLHKKSMLGYLVRYFSMGIYHIYHPSTKKIKVSRDVIFSEDEFIGLRRVNNSDKDILSSENDVDDSGSESSDHVEQNEIPADPIIHDESKIETPTPAPAPLHDYGTRTTTGKLPNRRERRTIARAFKAV